MKPFKVCNIVRFDAEAKVIVPPASLMRFIALAQPIAMTLCNKSVCTIEARISH